jgi:hypothetical protein
MSESADRSHQVAGQLGVLTREFRVRVLNCSSSGCLVETNARLDVGTIGSLRLTIGGSEFVDDVLVVRCQNIEGAGSMYHVGAKFLWIDPPSRRTLRGAMLHGAPTQSDFRDPEPVM